ncbi:MAG: GTP 3',8-cyclase MoaA [Deltaproteobacteria bacterium]|nr:GTP 3',8-cyclase MoaA [Deltaproteobacteria bacterium]
MRLERAGACAPARLSDAQGRLIQYLRLSLTDRCNFRCSYCSVSDYEDGDRILSRAEIARIAAVFARLGVRRIRLTGGEPTLRRELTAIVADLRATPGIDEVALTTNAHKLAELSAPLREAGLTALNVSLDTLDAATLRRVSGRGAFLEPVLEGIRVAARAGFPSLKVNTVVMGGVNDGELGDLVRFAWGLGATPRFIELMPFGDGVPVPTAAVKERLAAQGVPLAPDPKRGWGPAHYMRGEGGLVGFIGAITENFCESCNRARLTAEGGFQACLGGRDRVSLRDLLRAGAGEEELAAAIHGALSRKDPRHHMDEAGARLVTLPMMGIGG